MITPRPRYPSLYQINTRVRLSELAAELGRPATLDDISDRELDSLKQTGFDLVWFLGVWQTGPAGRKISLSNPEWLEEYHRILPDFKPADVSGSCFAIQQYRVHSDFGGDPALDRLLQRVHQRGLGLVLDFVPNHTAPDHPWVTEHPEYYVSGTADQLAAQPQNYTRISTGGHERILAYGRDPYFPGWPDTLQLNYGNPQFQEAWLKQLTSVAARCDGVRCDMAMLVLPEVFERTWGIKAAPFWPRATKAIHAAFPGFIFLAEVYWDLEWTLQQNGFDYTYDKRLYDRLREGHARPVREHLLAVPDYQDKLARFLENHDEPRAAATFSFDVHRAAAIITFLTPGLRFFHQGQLQGKQAKIPMHLGRGPKEPVDEKIEQFYCQLLSRLKETVFREGEWKLLDCRPAWEGNSSAEAFVAFAWSGANNERRLVVVNYSEHQSQCYASLPWADLEKKTWRLSDHLSNAIYDRDGQDLAWHGLYLDLGPWAYHVFDVQAIVARYAEVEAPVLAGRR
jgi:Alpha amylase, catalytic domain